MLDRTGTQFSHVKPADTDFVPGGLRDFFLYRDLGIAEATHGKVIAHLVKANMAPEAGTGWHRHEAEFQIVIMTKGWAKFMYEDKETLVQAGDVVHHILQDAAERGLGFSTFVSAGNRADASGNDLIQYREEDPDTDLALLYLETFGNARRFARIALAHVPPQAHPLHRQG